MLADLQKRAQSFFTDNATTILTAGGVVGTVTTAVLTGRATLKAAELIRDAEIEASKQESIKADHVIEIKLSKTDKVKEVWPLYIPPVVSGSLTVGSIIMANRMSAQQAAALAALYGASAKQRDEYKAKLEEKLGIKKAEAARDEMQKERIDERPVDKSVVIIGNGDVMCYDAFSDRYFKSTAEQILRAEAKVQNEILRDNECPLRVFYEALGLPNTHFDDMVGWNLQHSIRVHISTMQMYDDEHGDPCLCIEFHELPMTEYSTWRDG